MITNCNAKQTPFQCLCAHALALDMPFERGYSLCSNINECFRLLAPLESIWQTFPLLHTSTVSSTFITPGCLSVRSFLTAFRARGSRDLLALMSKEKMLQLEPSSYSTSQPAYAMRLGGSPYTLLAILKHPYSPFNILAISK